LLREGFWKQAAWLSRCIESGANVDCPELTVLQPWLSEYVNSVLRSLERCRWSRRGFWS